jgi:hypothetical protein
MKHLNGEQLVLYHYGEPLDREAIEAHLAACERCRIEKAALDGALQAVGSFSVPERGEGYGAEVWQRLASRLSVNTTAPVRKLWPMGLFWPRWALGVGAAALVAFAFLAGRYWRGRPMPATQAISKQARDRVLMAAVADHFERAEIFLTVLKHAGAQSGQKKVDISFERELAADLLAGNQLYEESALRDDQAGLASLLDQLGRVLVTVANAPATVSPAELAEFQESIDHQGILFKIQVLDSRLREGIQAGKQAGQFRD